MDEPESLLAAPSLFPPSRGLHHPHLLDGEYDGNDGDGDYNDNDNDNDNDDDDDDDDDCNCNFDEGLTQYEESLPFLHQLLHLFTLLPHLCIKFVTN